MIIGALSRDDNDAHENRTYKLHSHFLNKFVINSFHFVYVMWPNYPGANVANAQKEKGKLIIMHSCSP